MQSHHEFSPLHHRKVGLSTKSEQIRTLLICFVFFAIGLFTVLNITKHFNNHIANHTEALPTPVQGE